jgi:hypothetical protein
MKVCEIGPYRQRQSLVLSYTRWWCQIQHFYTQCMHRVQTFLSESIYFLYEHKVLAVVRFLMGFKRRNLSDYEDASKREIIS